MRRLSFAQGLGASLGPLSFLLLLVLACAPNEASAEPTQSLPRKPWELGPMIGYGTEWTTGLSHWGAGVGLSLDYELRCHFTFGGALLHHLGGTESATGVRNAYAASARSDSSTIHAGYSFWIANRLLLRPELALLGTIVSGTSDENGVKRSNLALLGGFGPTGVVMVRAGSLLFGVEGDAWFVPSHVAGPVGALYGVFRTRL
jgi:hypothetical protein